MNGQSALWHPEESRERSQSRKLERSDRLKPQANSGSCALGRRTRWRDFKMALGKTSKRDRLKATPLPIMFTKALTYSRNDRFRESAPCLQPEYSDHRKCGHQCNKRCALHSAGTF